MVVMQIVIVLVHPREEASSGSATAADLLLGFLCFINSFVTVGWNPCSGLLEMPVPLGINL